jgi:hypothetical protein
MLSEILHMRPEIDEMVDLTSGIPALSAQHTAALRVQQQLNRRLDGESRFGGADDFSRRLGRIRNQINNYYAHHPDAARPLAQVPRGHEAGVPREVLEVAVNMMTGIETVVFHNAADAHSMKAVELLQDLALNREVDRAVITAARQANNSPAALVDSLLALVRQGVVSRNTRW